MILHEAYTLTNGVKIPKLGLGTWFISDDTVANAVTQAVTLGYTHIDTAQAYKNERGVGEGIKNAGIARDQLFVTTKLAAEIKTYHEAVASIDGSLKIMGLEYIDLMIIHSPKPWAKFAETNHFEEGNQEAWRALEDAYQAGKLRSIGVSNFKKYDLENILSTCTVPPMVNQILAHISNMPFELIDYCKSKNILVQAYSPIGHGELLKNEEVKAIAEKYNVSVAQLGIRFLLQEGLLPLPKTANVDHMKTNAAVDFEITAQDMKLLANMKPIEHYGEASKFPVFAK